jgi:hydroxyacid-oxoacid transhydrogenase
MAHAASRNTILRLINAAQHSACPCHTCTTASHGHGHIHALSQMRNLKYATLVDTAQKEYAFEASFYLLSHGSLNEQADLGRCI